MIGNQPIPFCDLTHSRENSVNSYDAGLLRHLEESWLVEDLDTETTVVVKSEEQMEATAKELYTILWPPDPFPSIQRDSLQVKWLQRSVSDA